MTQTIAHRLDETPWQEAGQLFWLWVFVSAQTVIYQVGKTPLTHREPALRRSVLRLFDDRWLQRLPNFSQALALYQCLDSERQAFGEALLLAMILLLRNIHRLRESPPEALALRALNQNMPALLRTLCEAHQRELNPWEFIAQVLAERRKNQPAPRLPMPVLV